ncbi:uncharacterized protein LOC101860684 isoform X2 [Aplysia californica]|uniref:Uncharacterized protein LOC101860684 isoform X2 n=1 Tax=Aplysia californica TaxID=6500 RepID=A0ABM1A7W5_APLCA|nr:uncharacterized protein LOC101860684 isoform X2 [Aplysia californica]
MDDYFRSCAERARTDDSCWSRRRVYVNSILCFAFLYGFYLLFNIAGARYVLLRLVTPALTDADERDVPNSQERLFFSAVGLCVIAVVVAFHLLVRESSHRETSETHGHETGIQCDGSSSISLAVDDVILGEENTKESTDNSSDKNVVCLGCDVILAHVKAEIAGTEPIPRKSASEDLVCKMRFERKNGCPAMDDNRIKEQEGPDKSSHVAHSVTDLQATMTEVPEMVDAAVNTQQLRYKSFRNSGTSTSGPFLKKLRRAQRLLHEARWRTARDRKRKILEWRAIMGRYQEKLLRLTQSLISKDHLIGYTVSTRKLSEEEVKVIRTTVRFSQDKLESQQKMNKKLETNIEEKSTATANLEQEN